MWKDQGDEWDRDPMSPQKVKIVQGEISRKSSLELTNEEWTTLSALSAAVFQFLDNGKGAGPDPDVAITFFLRASRLLPGTSAKKLSTKILKHVEQAAPALYSEIKQSAKDGGFLPDAD